MSADDALEFVQKTHSALKYVCEKILSEELNIKGKRFLKSEYILVPLSYYVYKKNLSITPSNVESIKRWLILASFNKRYTGRLESDLKEDIELLCEDKGFQDLIGKLGTQSIVEEWFDRPYEEEHLLTLMILLRDAYDMRKGTVRLSSLNQDELHIHHIFPKSVLKKCLGTI